MPTSTLAVLKMGVDIVAVGSLQSAGAAVVLLEKALRDEVLESRGQEGDQVASCPAVAVGDVVAAGMDVGTAMSVVAVWALVLVLVQDLALDVPSWVSKKALVGTLVLLLHEQSGEPPNLHHRKGMGVVQGLECSSWACKMLCWVEEFQEKTLLPSQMIVLGQLNLVGGGETFALGVGVAEVASYHHRQ